jgi:hypothetical protein
MCYTGQIRNKVKYCRQFLEKTSLLRNVIKIISAVLVIRDYLLIIRHFMYFVQETHKVDVLYKLIIFNDVHYFNDFQEDTRELRERLVETN